jgi:hypothetical protein
MLGYFAFQLSKRGSDCVMDLGCRHKVSARNVCQTGIQ